MYDEILEKTNYWDDDQDVRVRTKDKIEAHAPEFKRGKIRKWENKLPSLKVFEPRKPVSYKTPWNGFEEYIKQCQRSEKTSTCN